MSLPLSQIFKESTAQAFRGLTNVLVKTKDHASAQEIDDINFLDARLFPDMHEMKWQVQMITEFAVRGAARMTGVATDDLPNIFFHVTTVYNLARMQGVAVGKRDFMGL